MAHIEKMKVALSLLAPSVYKEILSVIYYLSLRITDVAAHIKIPDICVSFVLKKSMIR